MTSLPVPACVVLGKDVELADPGIPLQLEAAGPVFASVARADDAELRLEADAQGTRASLDVRVGDARLLGWVRRETLPVHPHYLATFADVVVLRRFHVTAVRDADLDTASTAPAWALPVGTQPLAPRVHRCSELTLGPGPASISTSGPLRRLIPDGQVPVRRDPKEPPRLTLTDAGAVPAGMRLESRDGFSKMWFPLGDVDVVGWIPNDALIDPTPGYVPRSTTALAPTGGARCATELPLYVAMGGVVRRVGSLGRGAHLVPHGDGAFVPVALEGGVVVAPGATFVVRRTDLATCVG